MSFNIYNSLILVGVIQGFIFGAIVLSSKKYRNTSTYFLVSVILCFSYNNLQYYLSDSGIITSAELFSTIYLPIATLSPVLLYFYVNSFLYPSKKISFKSKLLLIPFFLFLTSIIIYKIIVALSLGTNSFYYFYDWLLNFHELFSMLFTQIILVVLYREIIRFEKSNKTYKTDIINHKLNWLKITLILLFILTLVWGTLMITAIFHPDPNYIQSFYLLWIGLSAIIYWLGHIGIYKYGILEQRKKIRSSIINSLQSHTTSKQKNEHIKGLENLIIKEKQFLDPTLTLDDIAKNLNISKSHLSRIINNELGISFSDYLNSLRVEKAKEYIRNSEFSNYTLVAIGYESGFNSKSTFNIAFKKFTNITPSEYKKQHIN